MADDERIGLRLDVTQSTADVKKLAEEVANAKRESYGLADGLDKLYAEQQQAATTARKLADEEQRLADEAMDEVVRKAVEATQAQRALNQILEESTTTAHASAAGVKQLGAASGDSGRAMLTASYAVQDFTSVLAGGGGLSRALGSVQNNIPGLLSSLGAGAGLAGVVSVASVGVGILLDQFLRLYASWDGGGTEKEAERLQKLAEAAENARKAIQGQIDALRSRENKSGEGAEIVKAAIGEAGGVDATVAAVQKQLGAESDLPRLQGQLTDAERRQARAEARKAAGLDVGPGAGVELDESTKALAAIRDAIKATEDDVRQRAQQAVVAATQGDKSAIADLARRFPGSAFGQATDEAIRQQNAEVDAVDAQGQRLHDARARKRADDANVDALNRQGQQNEGAMAKAQQDDRAAQHAEMERILDKTLDAGRNAVAKGQADLDDPRTEARRADIRERSELGREFRQRANAEGQFPNEGEVAQAAKSVQDLVHRGLNKDQAMVNVFRSMVVQSYQLQQRTDAITQQLVQIQQGMGFMDRRVGWQGGPR